MCSLHYVIEKVAKLLHPRCLDKLLFKHKLLINKYMSTPKRCQRFSTLATTGTALQPSCILQQSKIVLSAGLHHNMALHFGPGAGPDGKDKSLNA
jgi:hypothetical protein